MAAIIKKNDYKSCNSDHNVLLFYLGIPILVLVIVLTVTLILSLLSSYTIISNIITTILSIGLSCYFIDKQVNKIKLDCYNYGINKLPNATSIVIPINKK